ncbi:Adenine phosphoribosyl transferase 4 [Hibiscus syriacus]|uniref:Adenine phosphoribosyl transferase 4 n=1 Tax=Hibiscus syriacus TaxID=106335 RepID=A0A6A2YIC8_HIBSY|nr:Adenine phosphoribosyl transferase 4 [Hibiscus syriacus]
MASGWVKSLHCKSRAFEDVYNPNPRHLIPTPSCRRSSQSIKDVIKATKNPKPEPDSAHPRPCRSNSVRNPDPVLPALSELPDGHPSRNVVEIIFHTSWSPKAFMGRIEMIFKVQNGPKTVTRFGEYREMVMARSGSAGLISADEENARCLVDGNEVMRFHCLGPTSANTTPVYFPAGKERPYARISGAATPTRVPEVGGGGKRCWFAGL